jgi:hypothetical protein
MARFDCAYPSKDLDEIKPNHNPYLASIIDLNQTLGSFDLAMIAR